MTKLSKVLVVGCSYSSLHWGSGWKEENYCYLYPKILESKYKCNIVNVAFPGLSNDEIFYRTLDHVTKENYDLCIVQWSGIDRVTLYESEKNLLQPLPIIPWHPSVGHLSINPCLSDLHSMLVTYYNNHYIKLKHWFLQQITLQTLLKEKQIPFLFLRGFANYIPEFEMLPSIDNIKVETLDKKLKDVMQHEYLSDDTILPAFIRLVELYHQIDKSFCIGYNFSKEVYGLHTDLTNDKADDERHPGKLSNKLLAEQIIEYVNKGFKN